MDTKQFHHSIAKYIQASNTELNRLRESETALLNKVASLQKSVQLHKEASQQSTLHCSPEDVANLAENVIRAGFLKEASRQDFIDNCLEQPTKLIPFLDKLATLTINNKNLPVLGNAVEKEAGIAAKSGNSSDNHWESFTRKLALKMN